MLAILAESALRALLLGGVVWVGLNLMRVRNPHVHMTCWAMVLVASLSMPLLMHWTTVTITVNALPVPATEHFWPAGSSWSSPSPEPLQDMLATEQGMPATVGGAHTPAVNWLALATIVYALVAGLLLLRLAVGLYLTWRLARAAKPMRAPWTADWSVRVSSVIAGPVTFGSTILLPSQCFDWDVRKRQAVLAHEGAHVANRDFYLLLLASLNRSVFWFSPFAWWHLTRLAELAEIISDATALEVVEDRLSYAEILLDLVQHVRRAPAGIEMARACTVRSRVERILTATTAPAKLGWGKRIGTAAVILPIVLVSAGSIAYRTVPVSSPSAIDRVTDAATAVRMPQSVTFYSLGRASIFTVSRDGDELFGQVSGQRKLRLATADDGTYFYPAPAGPIFVAVGRERRPAGPVLRQNGRDISAIRVAELSSQSVEADAGLLDSYVGFYHLGLGRVLTITREGERLSAQETGRPKFEIVAHGVDAFASSHDDLVVFLRDGQAKVTQVLLHEPVYGARLAPRVGAARAKAIEEDYSRRIAAAPDRFRYQTPLPGSKETILRGIDDLQRGAPNYERMSAPLAANIRRQASELQAMFKAFGAVESIFFRGVSPGGYDIYGAKFTNGVAEFRILLGTDDKVDDVIFRPDGNNKPGGIVACSEEGSLRATAETAPIKVLIYNGSGSNLQLFKLDAEGKRAAFGTIGEDMTFPVTTYVDSPWMIADGAGKCLEIVLPGQQTRFHTVEASGRPGGTVLPRTVPLAGSEATLRQYIEAVSHGAPDYDRMTAEVAAQTRQQLPFNQAILSRLGALRAMSFRGVSGLGSDVYIVQFANGSAEWRIGLVKDGTIGRIALGPQY